MSSTALDYLGKAYDPDMRTVTAVSLGSAFVLVLFLAAPDFTNPYYVVGVASTVFALVSSVAILAFE